MLAEHSSWQAHASIAQRTVRLTTNQEVALPYSSQQPYALYWSFNLCSAAEIQKWSCVRVVRSRSAKPVTSVQIRSGPHEYRSR